MLDTMCTNGLFERVGVVFLVVWLFQWPGVLGQPDPDAIIFQFGNSSEPLTVQDKPDAYITVITNNNIRCLTGESTIRSSKCFYDSAVQLVSPCPSDQINLTSFSTMFQATLISNSDVQGLAFIIAIDEFDQGMDGGYLGWLNTTSNGDTSGHNFAVEIDLVQNSEFRDPPGPHVGVNLNSLTSVQTSPIYGFPYNEYVDHFTAQFVVWIQYGQATGILDVFVSYTRTTPVEGGILPLYSKPDTPTISTKVNLKSTIGNRKGMFVGFSSSDSGIFLDSSENASALPGPSVNLWTFNSNGPAPDIKRSNDDRKKREHKIILLLATMIPSGLLLLVLAGIIYVLYRRLARLTALSRRHEIEKGVLDRGPNNFKYRQLSAATNGFNSKQLLGSGGFGSVYKGSVVLKGDEKQTEVAVKRISAKSNQGAQEFLAEVKIIGQAQHRNLVRLLGWCHEKGELLLVYDYMPNGSVDQHLFSSDHALSDAILTWSRRLKIVSGVATAIAYLHDEWEQRVIHRDVKCSNVMLDGDFNARLGDFGLARLSSHDKAPPSTAVLAGTYGYMAPELFQTLKPTVKTDVYSFGAMVLEVATGKHALLPLKDREPLQRLLLVDWVWDLYREDSLLNAADSRLQNAFDPGEMIMFLKIGLLCSHPDPDERPDLRALISIWKGSSPFPPLPRSKPVPVYPSNMDVLDWSYDDDTISNVPAQESVEDAAHCVQVEMFPTGADGDPKPSLRLRHNASLPF